MNRVAKKESMMTEDEDKHIPVLPRETLAALDIKADGVYADCTLGGGGHSQLIAGKLAEGSGRLIGFDRYARSLEIVRKRLEWFPRFEAVHADFKDFGRVWDELQLPPADGVLYDLGLSSIQLDDAKMGLSFMRDDPLDMRYDGTESTETAADIIAAASEAELLNLFFRFGERRARRIARKIVEERELSPIETTGRLSKVIASVSKRGRSRVHPATRCFLALRSRVNRELESLAESLPAAIGRLKRGGRIVVLTYHSLEARITKDIFTRAARGCSCELPHDECMCSGEPLVKWVNRKSVKPSEEEIYENPRARSAQLRSVERL